MYTFKRFRRLSVDITDEYVGFFITWISRRIDQWSKDFSHISEYVRSCRTTAWSW